MMVAAGGRCDLEVIFVCGEPFYQVFTVRHYDVLFCFGGWDDYIVIRPFSISQYRIIRIAIDKPIRPLFVPGILIE